MNKIKIERRCAAHKAFSNGMKSILSSTDKSIEDSCGEAELLYSKYAKSIGCTLTTENIKQITNDIHRILGESMKEEIGRENILMEITDKRKFHAYKFTGTDENIDALRLLMQQMNNKFTIFRAYEFDCFCMSLKDIGGAMTYKDLDIGDWIIFKSEEGKEVVSVITDELFSNHYEAVEHICYEEKSTSTIKKEKRNAEVKAMEIEVQSILSSATGTTLKDTYDEIDLLHKKHLKSIRYTGEPENIKEIEDLVSSWDFEYISRRSFEFDYPSYTICRPTRENIGYSDVSIFDYIEINDYVFEAYDSTNKVIKIN